MDGVVVEGVVCVGEQDLRGVVVRQPYLAGGIVSMGCDVEALVSAAHWMNEDRAEESLKDNSVEVVDVVAFILHVGFRQIDNFYNAHRRGSKYYIENGQNGRVHLLWLDILPEEVVVRDLRDFEGVYGPPLGIHRINYWLGSVFSGCYQGSHNPQPCYRKFCSIAIIPGHIDSSFHTLTRRLHGLDMDRLNRLLADSCISVPSCSVVAASVVEPLRVKDISPVRKLHSHFVAVRTLATGRGRV